MVSRGQLELGQCIDAGVGHGTPASWTGCANDAVAATNAARTGTTIRFDLCLTIAPSFGRKYFVLVGETPRLLTKTFQVLLPSRQFPFSKTWTAGSGRPAG